MSARNSPEPAARKALRTRAVLRAHELSVGWSGRPVCGPASFAVGAGRAVALIGPNGSGKSTVLRAVLGLLTPLGGSVTVLGKPVDERETWFRASVSAVLDDDAWFPALTVAEHLYLVARGHGVADATEHVDDLIEEFGLADHASVLPSALSSGQRRRVLLAAGLVRPRALLVLDEPEQRLDSAMRRQLAQRLVAEKESGGAVLLATHDAELLATVADRAVIVDDVTRVVSVAEAVAALAPGAL